MTGRPRKPFNKHEILKDHAVIYLPKRTGEIFKCIVDLEGLQKLIEYNRCWSAMYDKKLKKYYAASNTSFHDENGKYKQRTLLMHKFLLDYKGKNEYVDHKNSDPLDNRFINLIAVNPDLNSINREGANSNNTTGYRNVSLQEGKYAVQLQINGKNNVLGRFDTPEEANECAIKMREKYYLPLIKYIKDVG